MFGTVSYESYEKFTFKERYGSSQSVTERHGTVTNYQIGQNLVKFNHDLFLNELLITPVFYDVESTA